MGLSTSKNDKNEALRLCKQRRRFIKQAMDSRYALAASHVSYIQSLKNIGIALRRFAEAEVLIESSLSTTSVATELEKTPSHTSFPSPSLSHLNEVSDSPLHNEETPSPNHNQISQPEASFSYMRTGKSSAVTVRMNANNGVSGFVEEESLPPPPPPPHTFESGSWDFFDPSDHCESFSFMGQNINWLHLDSEEVGNNVVEGKGKGKCISDLGSKDFDTVDNSIARNVVSCNPVSTGGVRIVNDGNAALEQSSSKREKDLCAEREDPTEFITHRAKDFLSSVKDIEHRFFRASESGREVSRMLESNKITVGFSVAKVSSSASDVLAVFQLVCCRGRTALVSHGKPLLSVMHRREKYGANARIEEPMHHVTKVISWKRTTSSRSSSSRNPLAAAARDDVSDSGSNFVEEFSMIAGTHSSTLERLFAWERKLYDEVRASESLRKEYDRKCNQLRHQFAKDYSSLAIDKTRAVVKDLHSQITVGLRSIDSISRRIEKMRDEELHPQLVELIQGLNRMWKAMLECHHAQYITISLAYHSKNSTRTPRGDTRKQILAQLLEEIEIFGVSFADWVNSLTSYVESLNSWLQNCILQPQGHSKSKRPFSPRRAVAPPIFVLCRDWSVGIKALPSVELSNDIKSFIFDLRYLMEQQAEHRQEKLNLVDASHGESEGKDGEKSDDISLYLSYIHSSLAKVLDRLNKFSEASLKMYEDIRQKSEAARVAYANCKPAAGY